VLRLSVDEGPRYRMTELAIDAPSREDSAAFAALLEIDPSGWMAPAALARAIERAVRRAADQGYPYATLGVSRMRWDSAGAQVRLGGALGPAVTVSGIRIDGLRATRQKTAEDAMGPLVDRPFSEAAAAAARERLARLGLFRAVEYQGLQSEADFRRARLVYQVEEPRYNRFEGAAGLQTEGQVVGLASIALDNLAGTGRALGLRWESSGRGIADFHARYAEPMLFGAPLTATLAAEHHDQDTIYTRTRWGAEVRYALSEHNRIAAGYAQERAVQTQAEPQSASTQVTEFTVERDGRDRPAAPRRGSLGRLTAEQAFRGEILRSGARRNIRTSAVEGLVDWHRPLGARSGLSLELSGAGRFSPERVLPLFDRYPVGGAASLRGHDEQAYLVDRYGLSRLEWRRFLGERGERVFLFWDHAIMGTTVLLPDDSADLQVLQKDGIGFGLRLDAAGGTVGVDYGLEPGRPPLEGKIHLRLVSTF
jgi:outer membrane protein assembly factor BamA